jgi:hypothetical protein
LMHRAQDALSNCTGPSDAPGCTAANDVWERGL